MKDSINEIIPVLVDNGIEICISNNASTDNTHKFIETITQKYPFIKYKQQPSNVGIDRNMIDVMLMATGEYILPLGDDDKIIFKNLNKEVLLLNDNFDLKILNGKRGRRNHLDKHLQGKKFIALDDAFRNLWAKMPFGSFVFNNCLLNSAYFDKYLNTSHAYTGIIWEALYDKFIVHERVDIVCGRLPSIEFKQEIKTWKNNAFKIMYYEIPSWFDLLSKKYPLIINENILENYMNKMSKMTTLMYYKVNDSNYGSNIHLYMDFFNEYQKNTAYQIDKVPIFLINFLLISINSLKRILKWINR